MSELIPDTSQSSYAQDSPVQRASSPAIQIIKLLIVIAGLGFAVALIVDAEKSKAPMMLQELREAMGSILEQSGSQQQDAAEKRAQAERERLRQAALGRAEPTTAPTPATSSALTRLVEKLPLPIETVFHPTVNLSASASQAQLSPDGGVVLTSKNSVMRYAAANPNDRQQLLSRDQYADAFAGDKFQAIRTALALPSGSVLFGGWHGEVLLADAGQWRRVSARDQLPKGSIAAMAFWKGQAWLGGAGLWRLNDGQDALQPVSAFSSLRRIQALLATDNGLLVADRHRVWLYSQDSAKIWSSGLPADVSISGLALAADGAVRVLSTSGIYRANADGLFELEHLPGVWIRQAQEVNGQLWVASWKQGLLLLDNGQWYRYGTRQGLASNAVSDLLIDQQDHLWVVTYGEGGWHASRVVATQRVLQFAWQPAADPD